VSISDLQEFENEFRARIEDGMKTMEEKRVGQVPQGQN
jgi:hypothetical protein